MDQPLADKVALITGAGRGIGRSIALGYARAGAAICASARTREEIDATARAITDAGGKAIAVQTDITDECQVAQMVAETVAAFGGLDILVANAGVHVCRDAVAASDPAEWWQTIETNLKGAYLCCRAAIPALRACGAGKIITIGSGMGHKGLPNNTDYCCSKAGLWMLTRVLAEELKEDRISVNE
ncbi:MAG: SDR family NAD(P)-dependent oxidoreductase, partial [Candidatus Latescibacteria bacterium]|nr:SDR family NAD(P)-dependent oxidoreductase [Candidatus Latescibacterota bacterium]